jgi:hypothetical protein
MTQLNISNHGNQRINQRLPQIKNFPFKEKQKYLLYLINNHSLIAYTEPDKKHDVYIGLFFKIVVSADCYHELVTIIIK